MIDNIMFLNRIHASAIPKEPSALQQLQVQLANLLPYDLEEINLSEYKNLAARWHDWSQVKSACIECAMLIFDRIVGLKNEINE